MTSMSTPRSKRPNTSKLPASITANYAAEINERLDKIDEKLDRLLGVHGFPIKPDRKPHDPTAGDVMERDG